MPHLTELLEPRNTALARTPLLAQGDIFVLDPMRFRERIATDIERNAAAIKAAGIEMQ